VLSDSASADIHYDDGEDEAAISLFLVRVAGGQQIDLLTMACGTETLHRL